MFKPVISADTLKKIISSLSALVDEATFHFTKENGLSCRVKHPTGIAMLYIQYPPITFKNFICDENINLTLNLSELEKFLRHVTKDENLELEIVGEKLMLNLVGPRYKNPMEIKTLEPLSEEEQTNPQVRFDAKIKLTFDSLERAINDVRTVSDRIKFVATANEFRMEGEGILGNMKPTFTKGMESLVDLRIRGNDEVSATYPLTFLFDITQGSKGSTDIVTLEFGNNLPLHLSLGLISGVCEFWVAPRIERD